MSLDAALLIFLLLAYVSGSIVVFIGMQFKSIVVGLLVGFIGYVIVLGIRKVVSNSLSEFLYNEVDYEANKLCYDHSEEALNLLSKGKYEDLKLLLIKRSNDADNEVRKIDLKDKGIKSGE